MFYTCTVATPLGDMTAAANGEALTGLWFLGQKYYPRGAEAWLEQPEHEVFSALRAWLEDYFAGRFPAADLPLAPQGTPFQTAVWKILRAIPRGEVTTYGAIARELSRLRGLGSMSAQAVGGAVGHNPISIIIPCHRVVGANGSLTGYAGGLDRKKNLLELEKAVF